MKFYSKYSEIEITVTNVVSRAGEMIEFIWNQNDQTLWAVVDGERRTGWPVKHYSEAVRLGYEIAACIP